MTTKKNDSKSAKKNRVKVDKLQVNNEIVEDLADKAAKQIKGGVMDPSTGYSDAAGGYHGRTGGAMDPKRG